MKISIITVVYNRINSITQALQSVQNQIFKDVEHLVIDGASTDGTLEVLNTYERNAIVLLSEPDDGIYFALNKGLKQSTGDIIGLMHSDDFFADEYVLKRVACAFEDPVVDLVYGDLDYVSKKNTSLIIRRWQPGEFNKNKLSRGWMPPHPTVFIRRRLIEKLGVYNTKYRISADYDLILRFFGQDHVRAVYIPQVLTKMRLGGLSNGSFMSILRKMQEDYAALRCNKVGGIWTLLLKNLRKINQFSIFFKN